MYCALFLIRYVESKDIERRIGVALVVNKHYSWREA